MVYPTATRGPSLWSKVSHWMTRSPDLQSKSQGPGMVSPKRPWVMETWERHAGWVYHKQFSIRVQFSITDLVFDLSSFRFLESFRFRASFRFGQVFDFVWSVRFQHFSFSLRFTDEFSIYRSFRFSASFRLLVFDSGFLSEFSV